MNRVKTRSVLQYASMLTMMTVGCGNKADLSELQNTLKQYGYIMYSTPMSSAGTGTMIGGGPQAMSVVAEGATCFPDMTANGPTRIRNRDDSSLPATFRNTTFNVDVDSDLMTSLGNSSPSITLGAKIGEVKSIQISFKGVHVDSMNGPNLAELYQDSMPDKCKKFLNNVPFIIQDIAADQMSFQLFNHNGGQIALNTNNLSQYINISANVNWSVDNNISLVIDSPRYIGYQLGLLRTEDAGFALWRASTVDNNNQWVFKQFKLPDLSQQNGTFDLPIPFDDPAELNSISEPQVLNPSVLLSQ